jgi:hypothetical protein
MVLRHTSINDPSWMARIFVILPVILSSQIP